MNFETAFFVWQTIGATVLIRLYKDAKRKKRSAASMWVEKKDGSFESADGTITCEFTEEGKQRFGIGQRKCPWCEHHKTIPFPNGTGEIKMQSLLLHLPENELCVGIKYCPMCGRDLAKINPLDGLETAEPLTQEREA